MPETMTTKLVGVDPAYRSVLDTEIKLQGDSKGGQRSSSLHACDICPTSNVDTQCVFNGHPRFWIVR